jgi:hypothetical protein
MDKIRLRARGFDGATVYQTVPTFRQVDGWIEASLETPVGIVPAGLWGKVPGGDPYLLHINVLTTGPARTGRLLRAAERPALCSRGRRTGRRRTTPASCSCGRPIACACLIAPQNPEVVVELLVESIGGTNELGSRLFDWAQATAQSAAGKVSSLTMHGPGGIPAWTGQLHIIHDSANADAVMLPTRGLVPQDAMLTFTRRGAGTPVLTASAGDNLAGGLANFHVTRSVFVINNGDAWAFAGV